MDKGTKKKFASIYVLTWNLITEAKEFSVCTILLSKTDSERGNGSNGYGIGKDTDKLKRAANGPWVELRPV